MRRIDRRLLFAGIALTAIVLLTLLIAPQGDRQVSGSTFSRAPDGYGAWYVYMQQQGTPIKRWKRPLEDFDQAIRKNQSSTTLLRIDPQLSSVDLAESSEHREWVKQGNRLVVLGKFAPATKAPFSTLQTSGQGNVKIETSRRETLTKGEEQRLGDRFGAIVWQSAIGKGQIIYATTPFLAANAYQDQPGNFAFLAQLVRQNSETIWVDEYLHGYKDAEVAAKEGKGNWLSYLTRTPLLPVLVQTIVLLLVLIWANNRRFGQPTPLTSSTTDNSQAYIQALSGVLYQSSRSEFVLEIVGREEQLQIQQALGLSSTPLEHKALVDAWVKQTKRPAAEVEQVLQPFAKNQRLSEQDLLTWIRNLQTVHQHLP